MANMEASYSQFLDSNWANFADPDGRASCCFLAYFKSEDALVRALRELSFTDFSPGGLVLPDGIKIKPHVVTDKKRIVLTYLLGMFTPEQAHEVIPVFSKHADHRIGKKQDLGTLAEKYLAALKEKGSGQIVIAF